MAPVHILFVGVDASLAGPDHMVRSKVDAHQQRLELHTAVHEIRDLHKLDTHPWCTSLLQAFLLVDTPGCRRNVCIHAGLLQACLLHEARRQATQICRPNTQSCLLRAGDAGRTFARISSGRGLLGLMEGLLMSGITDSRGCGRSAQASIHGRLTEAILKVRKQCSVDTITPMRTR